MVDVQTGWAQVGMDLDPAVSRFSLAHRRDAGHEIRSETELVDDHAVHLSLGGQRGRGRVMGVSGVSVCVGGTKS